MRLPRLPLVTALALLLFFAYITGIRLAYSLFYALVLLLVVSWVWSRIVGENLSLERLSPEGQFQVGDPFEERFSVENRSWVPVAALELVDFSSLPGYDPGRVFALKGRRSRAWTARGEFKQRGLFTFGPVELRYGDPFGLFPRTLRVPGSRSVVVYPVLRSVAHLEALAPSVAGDEQARGRLVDLPPNATTIREYVPTDSFKRIHWSSSARLGRLMSRSFETREGGDAWIVLDLEARVHAGEAPNSTLEYAISLAASINAQVHSQGRQVGLITNDSRGTVLTPHRAFRLERAVLEYLAIAQADGDLPIHSYQIWDKIRKLPGRMIALITPSTDAGWLRNLEAIPHKRTARVAFYIDAASFGAPEPHLSFDLHSDVELFVVRKGDDFSRLMRTRNAVRLV